MKMVMENDSTARHIWHHLWDSLETDQITKQGPNNNIPDDHFQHIKITGRVVFNPTQVQLSAWPNVGYKRQRQMTQLPATLFIQHQPSKLFGQNTDKVTFGRNVLLCQGYKHLLAW